MAYEANPNFEPFHETHTDVTNPERALRLMNASKSLGVHIELFTIDSEETVGSVIDAMEKELYGHKPENTIGPKNKLTVTRQNLISRLHSPDPESQMGYRITFVPGQTLEQVLRVAEQLRQAEPK